MTLAVTPTKELPWDALRRAAGASLLLIGLYFLADSFLHHHPELVGLGTAALGIGIALIFESSAEAVSMPVLAVLASLIPFGIFVACAGANPFKVYGLMYEGAFGSWFSFQNTLTRAAPLMLTGLCTALPMRVGLVIIGGEGALVVGALMAAGMGHFAQIHGAPAWLIVTSMVTAGFLAGGVWITIAGALKHYRGVNETISSLLLIYIGIALMNHIVEGLWRDPASLNKPSTWPILDADDNMLLGNIDFSWLAHSNWGILRLFSHIQFDGVHYGLIFGIVACLICYVIMNHTIFGFSAQIIGGNVRAAKVAGISLGKIIILTCMLAGGAAGLAGAIEVAAVQGTANASITSIAGYGYTGILVAFLARQNPLAILPVSILIGGIAASGGLLQRRLGLPDATVMVLQGIIFIMILASETYYGRFPFFKKENALG